MSEDTYIRDYLALERTRLANERTLLAYVRTGLTITAAGFAVAQFLQGPLIRTLAVSVMLLGAATILGGIWRFRKMGRKLRGG